MDREGERRNTQTTLIFTLYKLFPLSSSIIPPLLFPPTPKDRPDEGTPPKCAGTDDCLLFDRFKKDISQLFTHVTIFCFLEVPDIPDRMSLLDALG